MSIASTFAGIGKAGVGNQYLSDANRKLDARAPFSRDIRTSGNVAVAQIDIPDMPKSMAAHSKIDIGEKSFVGRGSENFKYEVIKNNEGKPISRNTDSEYKILDDLADKLGGNVTAQSKVTIFTERAACESCLGVVDLFQKKHPGITVEVIDNNDVMLVPRRLK
ncbi:deaminase domain-containing protein [Pectobacterium punjabense]|uniref:deaminase domain-containing protein n=1 Tax=Pectobacterium punjabense TaxID=2108399 RepID=UPI003D9B99AD